MFLLVFKGRVRIFLGARHYIHTCMKLKLNFYLEKKIPCQNIVSTNQLL